MRIAVGTRRQRCSRRSAAIAVAVIIAVAGLLQVLIPPSVGLADNGDGPRLVCALGLAQSDPPTASTTFTYDAQIYGPYHWDSATCGPLRTSLRTLSSEQGVLWVSRQVSKVVGGAPSGGLDLRVQAALLALAVGALCGWLTYVTPLGRGGSVGLGLAAGLLLVGTATSQYWASAYDDPSAQLGILALLPATLHLWRRPQPRWHDVIPFTLAALVLLLSTWSRAPLVVVLVVVLLAGRGVRSPARWIAAALLVGAAVASLAAEPLADADNNRYDAIFGSLLVHSPDPAGDLRALGASPDLLALKGSTPYAPPGFPMSAAAHHLVRETSPTAVVLRWFHHPQSLPALIARGARSAFEVSPDYLGSFRPDSGRAPGARADRWDPLTWVGRVLKPTAPLTLPLAWLALGTLAVRRRRRSAAGLAPLVALATGASVVTFATGIFGDGEYELVKHLTFTVVLLALAVIAAVALIASDRAGPSSAGPY